MVPAGENRRFRRREARGGMKPRHLYFWQFGTMIATIGVIVVLLIYLLPLLAQ